MRILLIGGTGNISAECAAWLAGRGDDVTVLTRGRTPAPAGCRLLAADRKDPAAMRRAVAQAEPEVVVDFLAYEVDDLRQDCELLRGRVRQFVFISSATVYAKPHTQVPLREDAPRGDNGWDYGRKKLECELWLEACRRESGFPVTVVRPSHTYSRIWVPNVVSSASYTVAARLEQGRPVFIPDDGKTPWTLTAASDFAAGLGGLLGLPEAVGESFHITSDEVLDWNRIHAEIAAAVGAETPQFVHIPTDFICAQAPRLLGSLKADKAQVGVFDNTKIKRFVPGFACRKPFRQGVRESVAWLRGHPELKNLKPELDAEIETVLAAWAGRAGAGGA